MRESIDDAPRPLSIVLAAPLPNGSLAGREHLVHECYTLTAPSGAATPELVLLAPRARGLQVRSFAKWATHHRQISFYHLTESDLAVHFHTTVERVKLLKRAWTCQNGVISLLDNSLK